MKAFTLPKNGYEIISKFSYQYDFQSWWPGKVEFEVKKRLSQCVRYGSPVGEVYLTSTMSCRSLGSHRGFVTRESFSSDLAMGLLSSRRPSLDLGRRAASLPDDDTDPFPAIGWLRPVALSRVSGVKRSPSPAAVHHTPMWEQRRSLAAYVQPRPTQTPWIISDPALWQWTAC